jgi:hypothetical protein
MTRIPRPIPAHLNAKPSSFASHTHASKARQTEKVDLALSKLPVLREGSMIDAREPPAPSSTHQRLATEPRKGRRTFNLRNRGQRRDRNARASSASDGSTLSGREGGHDASTPNFSARQRSQVGFESQDASPSGNWTSPNSEVNVLQRDIKQIERDEKEKLMQGEGTDSCGEAIKPVVGISDRMDDPQPEEQDGAEVPDSGLYTDMNEKQVGGRSLHDTQTIGKGDGSHKHLTVNSPSSVNQSETVNLKSRIKKLEKQLAEQKKIAEDARSTADFAILKEEEALKAAEKLDQDVQARARELEHARVDLKLYNDRLTTLRLDVEHLTDMVEQSLSNSVNGAPDTKTLKDLRWKSNSSYEAKTLHSNFLHLTKQMESKVQSKFETLSDQYMQMKFALAEKEKELIRAKKELQAAIQAKQALLTGTAELEKERDHMRNDRNLWNKAYLDECSKTQQAEHKFEEFRKLAEAMYRPNLEHLNKELQHDLTTVRDENDRLQERAQRLKTRARRWEGEYKTIKSRAEKESKQMKSALEQQVVEMLRYVKEYHDKVKDPAHWDLKPLQETVRALERDKEVIEEAFHREEREKSRIVEFEIPELLERIEGYEEENKKLKDAWAKMTSARLTGSTISKSATWEKHIRNDSTSISAGQFDTYVPKCLHPEETAKREAEVQRFREQQEERRALGNEWDIVLDQMRRWKMEEKLWDKKVWSECQG